MENRVIIDKNGSLRVESDNGLYVSGLHSCVLNGDFMIDSKSVANLILQQESKGGFKKVYEESLGKYCYVYLSNEEIAKALQEKDEKIKEIREELSIIENEKNRSKYEAENWKGCYERLKEKVEIHNKKWYNKFHKL